MAQNLTLEQAQDLVAQGVMTKKGFEKLVEEGQIQVFRFRTQTNKPEIVQTVHNALIEVIEPNAFELLNAGFRPSIVWNKIGGTEQAEEASE